MKLIITALVILSLSATRAWSQTAKTAAELGATPAPTAKRYYSKAPSARANWSGTPLWRPTRTNRSPPPSRKNIPASASTRFAPARAPWRSGCSPKPKRAATSPTPSRPRRRGLMTFRDGQLLLPYTSPHLAAFPEDAKERANKTLVYWTTVRESYVGSVLQQAQRQCRRCAEKLRRPDAPGAERQYGHRRRRHRRAHDRRHGQSQRRSLGAQD